MTPKGGIRPHKKFGVQANKAEVLFTDYIAEHLNSNGRAGIVVPNGIVATSQTAYKQLRKMLVQDSLIAVISLPAGVFQPYSGVKTSVLILDKRLAKKSQHILFLKIENDGFDLGAQRREIDKNDLPTALAVITNYKLRIANDEPLDEMPCLATLVEKETVLANKDVVLSAERYFETEKSLTEFELVKLGDERYFKIESGGTPSSEIYEYWNGNIHWATLKDLPASDFITIITDTERKISELGLSKSSAKLLPENSVLVSSRATIGRIAINKVPVATNQGFKNIIIKDFAKAVPEFIALVLTEKIEEMNEMSSGSTFKEISKTSFSEIEIPLPPLEVQQQIVAEIEGYQKIIDGAKQIVNNYKPTIKINPDWEMVELGSLCIKITDGSHFSPDTIETGYPYVTVRDVDGGKIDLIGCKKIDERAYLELVKSGCKPQLNDVLFSKDGTVGKVALVDFDSDFVVLSSLAIIRPDTLLILPTFLSFILQSDYAFSQAINLKGGVAIKRVVLKDLKTIKVPKISFNEQQDIVNAIEEEMQLVNANKRLIEIFEQKINDKIGEVWGVQTITD